MKESYLKLWLFALLQMCLVGSAIAEQLSVAQAVGRLRNSKGMHRVIGQDSLNLRLAYTESMDGSNLLYVMNRVGGKGSLILSADDLAPALLGYMPEGEIVMDSVPEALNWWLHLYAENISRAIKSGTPIRPVSGTHADIGPLLTTQWGQQWPYNNDCTDLGTTCLTGCVATAMAQIMNYYEHPRKGTGSHSYTYNNVNISSSFASHTYDWANMLNTYPSSASTTAQKAVSTLMRDWGVSVDMNYGTGGSGAASDKAAYALWSYFGYDKSLRNYFRSYMSDQEWEDILISELEAGRPMLYSGSSSSEGGHAFVCDGYKNNGYFHFNWGWKGYCDSYFLVTGTGALVPYEGEDDSYGFTGGQMVLTGIQPDQGGPATPGMLGMSQGYTLDRSSVERTGYFYLSTNHLANLSSAPFEAQLGVLFKNAEHEYYAPSAGGTSSTYGLGLYYRPSYPVYASAVMKNGTYEVYPVFKDMGQANPQWQRVTLAPGTTIPTLTVTGTEPVAVLSSLTYATSGGKRTKSNKVTTSDITIHVELEALSAFSSKAVTVYIFPKTGGSSLTGSRATFSASAGDTRSIDIPLNGSSLTVGETYMVAVYFDGSQMAPKEYQTIYINVVDHMPSVGDVPVVINKAKSGQATIAEVNEAVDGIIN